MNSANPEPQDPKLRALLRESRPAPPLPPRFTANVWRRIEQAETRGAVNTGGTWLDALTVLFWRPKLAFAVAVMLVFAGVGLGWRDGAQHARQQAQARYLAVVAPNSLR